MKGVKYNCIIDDSTSIQNMDMKTIVIKINEILNEKYNGLLTVNSNKIYNLINRPKLASKNLKKILKVEYVT